jgi:hypothetical protein
MILWQMNWFVQSLRLHYLLKIKSIAMQTSRIVQAVILMMVVALAASCAAGKEYTARLFAPRTPATQDSQAVATLRFLDLDQVEPDQSGWVTTDIINGKDTSRNTVALDKLSNTVPVPNIASKPAATGSVVKTDKTMPVESEPVAKTVTGSDGKRTKQTREDKPE